MTKLRVPSVNRVVAISHHFQEQSISSKINTDSFVPWDGELPISKAKSFSLIFSTIGYKEKYFPAYKLIENISFGLKEQKQKNNDNNNKASSSNSGHSHL